MNEDKDNNNNSGSSIKNLEKDLYSRNKPSIIEKDRYRLKRPGKTIVEEEWSEETARKNPEKSRKLSSPLFKKVFIFASVFFVLAFSIAMFIVLGGLNLISPKNINIDIKGLTVMDGGEELVLDVSVRNNNRVPLEDVSIVVEYPEGARERRDINNILTRQQENIDFIPAQGQVSQTFSSILFGEQNSVKEITVTVNYKIEGSNGNFSKSTTHQVGLRSSPVSVIFLTPKEVSAGQEVDLTIVLTSNSNAIIEDLIMTLDYPTGFIFEEADLAPSFENRLWLLGDLNPREKKEIKLKGRLEGTENEEKPFRVSVGLSRPENPREIGVEFTSSVESIIIQRPFIDLLAIIAGSTEGIYISQMNKNLRVDINWKNNVPTDLNDVSLEVKINGAPLDELSVEVNQNGFYDSITDSIVWNKNNHSTFEKIISGQSGNVSFSFNTLKVGPSNVSQLENGTINIEVVMKGVRFIESRPPEAVLSSISRRVKMETDLALKSEGFYSTGPFKNTGSLPPKAEKPTTYTLIWTISNTLNNVENVLVTATLPLYIEWLGKTDPESEEITYNPSTRTVVWNSQMVSVGTGLILPPRRAAFQVTFLPSFGQVGSTPILLNPSSIIGTDAFTLTNVRSQNQAINTRITNDPIYSAGMERVSQ